MNMQRTQKVCLNGHQMEPDWEVCPYCPSSGTTNPALARTVKIDATEMRTATQPPNPPAARKTEILERPPQIDGIAWLVGARGPEKGRTHRIDKDRALAGASPSCDIVLSGNAVSDQHASFRFQEKHFVVTDLDSTNGTFVNGDRIHQHALADGDRVSLGGGEWVFKCVVFEEG